jgi:hypothetical protein
MFSYYLLLGTKLATLVPSRVPPRDRRTQRTCPPRTHRSFGWSHLKFNPPNVMMYLCMTHSFSYFSRQKEISIETEESSLLKILDEMNLKLV